jgi:DNA-binding NarL/FixJ family response regulator
MDEDYQSLAVSQFLVRGDLDEILHALLVSLASNAIPFNTRQNYINRDEIQTGITVLLCDSYWGKVGQVELRRVDHTQTLVCIALPEYPDDVECEEYEQKIREALPASAVAIRIIDMHNERQKVLAYIGKHLHEHRIRKLKEITQVLANSLDFISFQEVAAEGRGYAETRISPPIPKRHMKEEPDRDIPIVNKVLRGDQQELLRLWQSGLTAKEIALRTSKTEKTILNQVTLLRKLHGEELVPRRR